MKTVTTKRDMNVKATVKSALSTYAKYKKLYSTVSKTSGDLTLKYYDVKATSYVAALAALEELGHKVKMKAEGTLGFKRRPVVTFYVTVDADKAV